MVVAPELRARVQLGKAGDGLGEAARLPVLRPAREVLVDVVAERHGEFLLLHGGEVEVYRLLDPALAHGEHVVDGLHVARTEDDARRELGGDDGFGELSEERLALRREPEHDVGHEDGDEPRERAAEIRLHGLDFGVARPERVGGFEELRAELLAEHLFYLPARRVHDGLFRLGTPRVDHRLADDADAHPFQRARLPARAHVRSVRRIQDGRARHRGERVARVVVAVHRVLERVEHFCAIGE